MGNDLHFESRWRYRLALHNLHLHKVGKNGNRLYFLTEGNSPARSDERTKYYTESEMDAFICKLKEKDADIGI